MKKSSYLHIFAPCIILLQNKLAEVNGLQRELRTSRPEAKSSRDGSLKSNERQEAASTLLPQSRRASLSHATIWDSTGALARGWVK